MLSLPLSEPDAQCARSRLRRPQGRGRLHDHVGARPAGASQPAYEGLIARSRSAGCRSRSTPPSIRWIRCSSRSTALPRCTGSAFPFYNILHVTNWVTNGIGERFPKLNVIWIEGGLRWVPFLMQRLDHEFMLRPSEFPLLKKKPSDYMRDMYYASQPMETVDKEALECTFRMINAETQLLYASDYPHWDFDLPSAIYDLRSSRRRPSTTSSAAAPRGCSSCRRATRSRKKNLRRFGNLAA